MREISEVLERMEKDVEGLTHQDLGGSGQHLFDVCLTAALAKSFEFAKYAHSSTGESRPFFASGTLRGICEDLIVLKVVRKLKPKDRKELLMSLNAIEIHEGMARQKEFLEEKNPVQPILTTEQLDLDHKDAKESIQKIKNKYGLGGRRWYFSKRGMAKKEDLEDLYNYLYHATSKIVHFNIKVLMRMGWGESESPEEDFEFSPKNFDPYYDYFNKFYSVYLLVTFSQTFSERMGFGEDLNRNIDELNEWMEKQVWWPELVTFEEMNIERPSDVMAILMNELSKYEDSEQE